MFSHFSLSTAACLPRRFPRPLTVSLQCRSGCPQKLKTPSIVNETANLSGLLAETTFMDSHPSRQACHPERSCHPVHVGPDGLGSPCASKLCRRRSMPSRDANIRTSPLCGWGEPPTTTSASTVPTGTRGKAALVEGGRELQTRDPQRRCFGAQADARLTSLEAWQILAMPLPELAGGRGRMRQNGLCPAFRRHVRQLARRKQTLHVRVPNNDTNATCD